MRSIRLAATWALAFGLFAQPSTAEELSVATFVPPNHESITVALAWFEKELAERSGGVPSRAAWRRPSSAIQESR